MGVCRSLNSYANIFSSAFLYCKLFIPSEKTTMNTWLPLQHNIWIKNCNFYKTAVFTQFHLMLKCPRMAVWEQLFRVLNVTKTLSKLSLYTWAYIFSIFQGGWFGKWREYCCCSISVSYKCSGTSTFKSISVNESPKSGNGALNVFCFTQNLFS